MTDNQNIIRMPKVHVMYSRHISFITVHKFFNFKSISHKPLNQLRTIRCASTATLVSLNIFYDFCSIQIIRVPE